MNEPDAHRLATDGDVQHNVERDLDRISMPPMAAELQASEIHHPDEASLVATGDLGEKSAADEEAPIEPPSGPEANPVLANFWQAVRRLPNYLRLAAALARDPRVPRRAKAVLAIGGAYTISPIDFVPGIIPIAGQLDDVYVLLTALRRAVRSSPVEAANEHLTKAGVELADLDADLAAVRALVRQAAATSLRVGGRLVKQASKRLVTMASRSLERGRRAGDNEPL